VSFVKKKWSLLGSNIVSHVGAVFYTVAIDILFACSTRYDKEANARMRSGLFEIVKKRIV